MTPPTVNGTPEVNHAKWARVVSIHDGDTLKVDIDQDFHDWKHDLPLRFAGSNAAELVDKTTKAVTAEGEAATLALLDRLGGRALFAPKRTRSYFGIPGDYLALAPIFVIVQTRLESTSDTEKYGRVLARIWCPDVSDLEISEWMITNGHAVPYGKQVAS